MRLIRRVMTICSIDTDCNDIAHYAASLARSMKAELFILTAIYNPFGVKGLSFPRPSLQRDFDALVNRVREEVRKIIDREKRQGIPIQHIIREGKPERETIAAVNEYRIDLLVLPAHTKTRLEYLLSAGYNKAMLRKMPCSVLFFKSEPTAVEEEEVQEEDWPAAVSANAARR